MSKESMPVTQALSEMLRRNQDEVSYQRAYDLFNKAIKFYKKQYRSAARKSNPRMALVAFHDLLDTAIQSTIKELPMKPSCRMGCAHCCHITVRVSPVEVDLIVKWCKDNKIEINQEYLRSQEHYVEENQAVQEHSACVFLDENNACKIYEVRPLACRKYFVVSDPSYCDARVYKKGTVIKVSSPNTECIASAFVSEDTASLPQALLKRLNKTP